jgi:hypothetical protein
MRHDPATSAFLRTALHERLEPVDLERRGLSAEERAAYELNYWELVRPALLEEVQQQNPRHRRRSRNPRAGEEESQRPEADAAGHRLRDSLSHAGARLVDYLERADSFRVHFTVGGRPYTSSVDKNDLTVQVSGICLSGEDQKFDLASLVGVLREGQRGYEILEIGEQGMAEEEYWRVHPPRN